MSYNENAKFKDFWGRSIELSEASWEHIQESHPEITLDAIQSVLEDPLEVRESPRRADNGTVELFYRAKIHPEGKPRFRVVVVKVLKSGLYVSTAMTVSAMKNGKTLYRKQEEKGEGR